MIKKKYLSNAEIAAFCQQIAMVLKAGLPTYYGVSILCDEACDEATQNLLNEIYKPMESGGTLYLALEGTKVFPPYMVNMIKIGEETGRLEDVLLSLSSYYEREDIIKENIKNAVTYPFVLTLMMLSVILVLIVKVLPAFSQIYTQLGSQVNGLAKTFLNISNTLNNYLVIIVFIFLLLLVAGLIFFHTQLGQILFLGKGFGFAIAASRFANCMSLALSSGLDTDQGLDLAETLIINPHMRNKIAICRDHIAHGESFSNALLRAGIFSKMYSSWIAIGSKTGSMDEIMQHICQSYESDIDDRLNRFISTLEPLLIVVLCAFIGMILVSFLLPLLGIMSSIK